MEKKNMKMFLHLTTWSSFSCFKIYSNFVEELLRKNISRWILRKLTLIFKKEKQNKIINWKKSKPIVKKLKNYYIARIFKYGDGLIFLNFLLLNFSAEYSDNNLVKTTKGIESDMNI